MGASIRVVGQKFFSKLNNGNTFTDETTDFSQHLKGGVLEEVKAVFNVQIDWNYELASYDILTDNTANTIRIVKGGMSLLNEGFSVGDEVKYSQASILVTGVISSISSDEVILKDVVFILGSLSDGWLTGVTGTDFLTGLTPKTALKYDFGLIENDEPINFLSKLTNTEQTYLFKGIDQTAIRNNPNATVIFTGGESAGNNKAAYTGSARVAFIGLSLDQDTQQNQLTTQEFQIEHTFKINPIYRDGELDSLKGIDVPPLDIYNGNLSLKYVFQTEFRTVINNPNTSMVSSYDTQLGSVGYLGESYNGYKNNYSVSDLVYTVNSVPVDRLEIGSITNVSFKINNDQPTFTTTTPVVVGHTSIVNSLYYANSTDEYQTVWTDEDLRLTSGSSPTQFNGTLIKNATSTYSGVSQLSISFDVEFTSEQELKLEDKQDYLLYFTIQDPNETIDTGDKVTDRIDVNYYFKNTDVAGLFDFDTFEQYPHPLEYEEGVSEGFTNAKTFNESGMMADGRFWVLNTATLNSLKFDVAVYDLTNDTWNSLRSLNIDLSDQILVNDIQQIELDTTRGYILKDGDIFNYLKLTTDTLVGTKQYYNIQIGYRMPWQSWLEFKDAPTDFYDKSKSYNGLNQKSSNYSLDNANYGIKVLFDAVVDSTNYVKTSEEIEVYDYDEDDQDPTAWTCEIKTLKKDPNDENSLVEIANNVIQDGYTQFQAIFTPSVPPTFTEDVDMTEVSGNPPTSESWNRFAHGNRTTSGTIATRDGIWANEQANDTDQFTNISGSKLTKIDQSLYTSSEQDIATNDNANAFYGCFSQDQYEFYSISGEMYSNAADNDGLAYNIAFITDDNGVEHTLSLVATTGGLLLDIDPDYILGDTSKTTMDLSPSSPFNRVSWALVYDFGKSGCIQLDYFNTNQSSINWNSGNVGDLFFNVNRSSDDITVDVDWTINSVQFTNTFNYNLNDNEVTEKFKGFTSIGFSFMSQDQGGFKDVKLIKPEGDFYTEMRIEPKESQSDFSDNRISSLIEAPDNNLLTEITGSIKKATLSYDGLSFIGQCLVDTTKLKGGENYDLSAEIRPINLEE